MRLHPLLDPSLRPVFGHRGNAAHAPENTLESFRQAVALGVDGLELDTHATADGRAAVMHDPVVDRTTGSHGAVAALSAAALSQFDAGARFTADAGRTYPYAGRGLGVPLLDDVLETFPEVPLLIELKSVVACGPTRQAIERHSAQARCVVASFDHRALEPLRGSGIHLGSSRRDVVRCYLPACLRVPIRSPGFDAMCIPRRSRGIPLPIRGLAQSLSGSGVLVHIWTVNDAGTARRLWSAGAHGIISDDPAVVLAERRRLFGA